MEIKPYKNLSLLSDYRHREIIQVNNEIQQFLEQRGLKISRSESRLIQSPAAARRQKNGYKIQVVSADARWTPENVLFSRDEFPSFNANEAYNEILRLQTELCVRFAEHPPDKLAA